VSTVDPEGHVAAQQPGELPYETRETFIERLIVMHKEKGTLNPEPLPLTERLDPGNSGPLRFPGGVDADIEGGLAVSDTGHHRVLYGHIVGNTLNLEKVIGSGNPGFSDGPLDEATFREPQGLTLSGEMLIVADRGNHAIRMVDLEAGQVATMAGTGELAAGTIRPGPPLETSLRSPWDVLLNDYALYIAMAGSNQIWQLLPHAGTGAESISDGPQSEPTLAQPMALATDEQWLYFADAESSSIRRTEFEPGGEVETLVGTGPFDHGDVDGMGTAARLQHCSGLVWAQGNHRLWISDTYNDKLRTLDPTSRAVETVEPFEADLAEPTALGSAGHLLYVADTGHHRLLRVDQIDKRVVELEIEVV
jgi:hypothetical protein